VLAGNGLCVHLTNADAATPAVSYAVAERTAHAGVMITASHNAPRYNGVKLKAAYGGSATPDQCRLVETLLTANELAGRGPNSVDYDRALERGQILDDRRQRAQEGRWKNVEPVVIGHALAKEQVDRARVEGRDQSAAERANSGIGGVGDDDVGLSKTAEQFRAGWARPPRRRVRSGGPAGSRGCRR